MTMTIATAWKRTRRRIHMLRLLAGHVLARRHRDDAADENVNHRRHREQEEDEQDDAHGGDLGVHEGETKRKLAVEEVGGERWSVDAFVAHCRERRREVALGEAAAVRMGDKRVMADRSASGRPSSSCSSRWTGVDERRSAARVTSVTPLAASSTTQAR